MLSVAPIFIALSLLALQTSANCMHGTSMLRREVSEDGLVKVSNFGYSGTVGPINWASIDPHNAACASGKIQSPIVIDDSIAFASKAPKISFKNIKEAEFENLGSTIEVIAEGTTNFAGKNFTLKQFHFHSPSEHRIKDEYFPLEVHMVHESADGAIAVFALLFQLTEDGSTTELLTNVIKNIGDIQKPGTVAKTGPLDFGAITDMLQTKPLFQYIGSLTTPPCSEGITFLTLSEALPVNVATYNAIKKTVRFNARYSQNEPGGNNLLGIAASQAAKDNTIPGVHCSASEAPQSTVDSASQSPSYRKRRMQDMLSLVV